MGIVAFWFSEARPLVSWQRPSRSLRLWLETSQKLWRVRGTVEGFKKSVFCGALEFVWRPWREFIWPLSVPVSDQIITKLLLQALQIHGEIVSNTSTQWSCLLDVPMCRNPKSYFHSKELDATFDCVTSSLLSTLLEDWFQWRCHRRTRDALACLPDSKFGEDPGCLSIWMFLFNSETQAFFLCEWTQFSTKKTKIPSIPFQTTRSKFKPSGKCLQLSDQLCHSFRGLLDERKHCRIDSQHLLSPKGWACAVDPHATISLDVHRCDRCHLGDGFCEWFCIVFASYWLVKLPTYPGYAIYQV